jgi:hypothetical protein
VHLTDLQFDALKDADAANETEKRDDSVAALVRYDEAIGIAESGMERDQPVQERHFSGFKHGFGMFGESFDI